MANLIDPNETMFTNFEPKLKMRFIMYIAGIPSFIIKKVDRPKFESSEVVLSHINTEFYTKGKSKWNEITAELYDPIVPSGAQSVMEWIRAGHESVTGRDGYQEFYKKDITMNGLGPVTDKVEEWTLKGAWCKSADFQDWDRSDENTAQTIQITIRYDYAILQY
jgi:hypothetical protein